MAYEVLYFDMPMYQAKCRNMCGQSSPGPASFSCQTPLEGILEDATWPGTVGQGRENAPDIIKEHQVASAVPADNCSVISDSRSSSNYSAPDDPDIELPDTIGEVSCHKNTYLLIRAKFDLQSILCTEV